MRVIILHYTADCVDVIDLPNSLFVDANQHLTTQNIEDYLKDKYNYFLDEIQYMVTNEDKFPVFYNGQEEPKVFL